jgi:glycosyltransferase involved in cell wall biosynthesis
MRIGQNPAKMKLEAYQPQELGIATLTYMPNLEGYFRELPDVLRLMLASLRKNTPQEYDLLVFDNGSCPEAQQILSRLADEGWIDFLVLSQHNLGKLGALNWIFGAMSNPWVCYSDSDVLFKPGWWEAGKRIASAFPQAGMIGGVPAFFDVLQQQGTAHLRYLNDPRFRASRTRPESWVVDEYSQSVGVSAEQTAEYHQREFDLLEEPQSGTRALVGASHMQFLAPQAALKAILPLKAAHALEKSETRLLDAGIDAAGYAHLASETSYVYHIGNHIDERVQQFVAEYALETDLPAKQSAAPARPRGKLYRLLNGLAARPALRGWLRVLYRNLFEVLAEK